MSDKVNRRPLTGMLEPEAAELAKVFSSMNLSDITLASLAISMRRIADHLDKPGHYGETGLEAIAGEIRRMNPNGRG